MMADLGPQSAESASRAAGYALTAGLTTSPWWVDYLNSVNVVLTTLTLITGVVLGVLQIVSWAKGKGLR